MTSNEKRTTKLLKINWPGALILCLFVVISTLSVNGCGGTFRAYPNEGDVNGTWNLSLTKSNVSVRETKLSITQEERYQPFSGSTSDGATLDGTLDRENIVITLHNSDGSTTTLTGTVVDGWNEFAGSYTSTGSDGSGTWSANRVVGPKALSVSPTSATLSCSAGEIATFVVTGGTKASYSVTASSNGSLVTISTTTLTTDGKFTVTALTSCAGTSGTSTVVNLTVTDTATSITVPVTVSNP